jgi:hypothetical protein
MYYAIVKDDKIEKFGQLNEVFPNVSFPFDGPNEEFLVENNAQRVLEIFEHDSAKNKLVYCDPYIKDGKVYMVEEKKFSKNELADIKKGLAELKELQGE